MLERGIRPELVVGTSIGAINGAIIAADVDRSLERLEHAWTRRTPACSRRAWASGWGARTSCRPVRCVRLLEAGLAGARTFDDLEVEFRCVAASIERAAEHWFTDGPAHPRGARVGGAPGHLPRGADRRRALRRRRHRQLHPRERGRSGGRDGHLRDAGGTHRAPAVRAPKPVRQCPGRVRDLAASPLRPRFGAVPEGTRLHVLPTGTASERENRIARNLSPAAVRAAHRERQCGGVGLSRPGSRTAGRAPRRNARLMRLPPKWVRRLHPGAARRDRGARGHRAAARVAGDRHRRVDLHRTAPAHAPSALDGGSLPAVGRRRAGRAVRAVGRVGFRMAHPLPTLPAHATTGSSRACSSSSSGTRYWVLRLDIDVRVPAGFHDDDRPRVIASRHAGPGRLVHPDPRRAQLVRSLAPHRA